LIEPFVCARANPMTDALCVEGMGRAARSLLVAFRNGPEKAAREDMALASLFGGLALANAGLGAVHGFAGPLGGMFQAPHGAVCAALLPHVMEMNIGALRKREPQNPALARYARVASLLTGNERATAEDGAAWVQRLVKNLQVPRLRSYGIQRQDADELVEKAAKSSSMKANPITLSHDELRTVFESAL
jgi:alcohol dehydrogenase class IV